MSKESEFGSIRSFLWPIHRHEVKKLVPMVLMLFLICLNYGILRNMKDSVVIPASGAEVIPFIKVWAILPMAILLTFIFTKLSNRYSQERVFYLMTSGFLLFFALFAFVLYPMRDTLHPYETADHLDKILPIGFKGLISMYRYWAFTLFYVISELWSTIVMSVLFWGFANEITRLTEVRRFYSVCGIFSNIAATMAGLAGIVFSQEVLNTNIPFGHDAWEQTMMMLTIVVLISGVLTMVLFRWMNRNVLTDPMYDDVHATKRAIKAKGRLSLKESVTYLSNSKYLLCIAVLVIAYNLVINLVEVVWKDRLGELYPSSSDINNYISMNHVIMGVLSTITALFMAGIISKFGWTRTALITPVIMLITTAGFFGFLFFQERLEEVFVAWIGMTPLAIAVFFGAAQNISSKAAKYTVFDTTKEMAFIPLSHECKLRGKAAIDGVGSRLGKSGGSLVHQGLLMFMGTVSASVPYVGALLIGVIILWIIAARSLGRQFGDLVASQNQDLNTEAPAAAPQVAPPPQPITA